MKKMIFSLLTLALILALVPAGMAKKPAPSLRCTIMYTYVGSPVDPKGRTLVWEGPISGDIEGVIQWWIDMDAITRTGAVSHYDDRWVILDGDGKPLLAGEESGSTTAHEGKDSIWRTNGTVTFAAPEFEDWIGRQNHAGGNAVFPPSELPSGEGTFRIN
jgi:hypothetical protein